MNIAGVTFKNEDGESRQEILKNIFNSYSNIITIRLQHVTYYRNGIGEPAIKCVEKSTKKMIGWLPKDMVKNYKNVRELTGLIKVFNNKYIVELYNQEPPTHAQYEMVKSICSKNNIPAPAYDRHAYDSIIKQFRMMEIVK